MSIQRRPPSLQETLIFFEGKLHHHDSIPVNEYLYDMGIWQSQVLSRVMRLDDNLFPRKVTKFFNQDAGLREEDSFQEMSHQHFLSLKKRHLKMRETLFQEKCLRRDTSVCKSFKNWNEPQVSWCLLKNVPKKLIDSKSKKRGGESVFWWLFRDEAIKENELRTNRLFADEWAFNSRPKRTSLSLSLLRGLDLQLLKKVLKRMKWMPFIPTCNCTSNCRWYSKDLSFKGFPKRTWITPSILQNSQE